MQGLCEVSKINFTERLKATFIWPCGALRWIADRTEKEHWKLVW